MNFLLRTKLILTVAASTFVAIGVAAAVNAPWEHEKSTKDGIVVHSRAGEGTTVREIRATMTIAAPPIHVLDAACDSETFRETTDKYVEENATYHSSEKNAWYNYQLVNYPMIDKRDYCLRYERIVDEEKKIYRLKWNVSNKFGPKPRDGVVRVTLVRGQLDIQEADDGKTSKVKYTLLADPGGNIPDWLINFANRTSLPDIMRELRDAAVKRASK